jgi:hypothetical protein
VPAVKHPPTDASESFTLLEDAPPLLGNVLDNAADMDGDTLTVTSFTVGVGGTPKALGTSAFVAGSGTLTLSSDGKYSFSPCPNCDQNFPVVSYTISDGIASVTSTLTIFIIPGG